MFKWIKKIPYFEALRAFLEQWGIWPWISASVSLFGGAIVGWGAWVAEQPAYIVALVFFFSLACLLGASNFAYGIVQKRSLTQMYRKVVEIDRDGLADELDALAEGVSSLVSEHTGPILQGWFDDSGPDSDRSRSHHTKAVGKLLEKFGARYESKAHTLIRRASKVVQINRSEHWQIEHGVRSELDIHSLAIFISRLADDVRNPSRPIEMYDPVKEARDAERVLLAPQGNEEKKQR